MTSSRPFRPKLEDPAYIAPGELRKFDQHGPILRGPGKEGQTRYTLILRELQNTMAKEKIPKEIKGRIGPLLQCLPISWSLSFRGRPETQEVAELLDSVLRPTRLLGLLRQAEKRGHLAPGTADALDAARGKFNPYLFLAAQIETELRLTLLTPRLRHMHGGRPSAFRSALVADAVADEIRKASKAPWPIVSGLFAPFLKVLRPQIKGDPTHLRQLVVNRKRIADRKVKAGKTNESWKDAKALLYQEAGLA